MMPSLPIPLIFLTFLLTLVDVTKAQDYDEPLQPRQPIPRYRHTTIAPPRYTRLTPQGAEQIKAAGLLFLNQQLVGSTRAIQWPYQTTQRGIEGHFQVSQMQPTGYLAPQSSYASFVAPSYVIFTMENVGISVSGRFFGNFAPGPFGEIPAQLNGQLSGISLAILTQFRPNANGGLVLDMSSPVNCSALVNNAQFTFEPDGQFAWYVKAFEQTQMRQLVGEVNNLFLRNMPNHLCNSVLQSIGGSNPLQELANGRFTEPLTSTNILLEKHIFWNGIIVASPNSSTSP